MNAFKLLKDREYSSQSFVTIDQQLNSNFVLETISNFENLSQNLNEQSTSTPRQNHEAHTSQDFNQNMNSFESVQEKIIQKLNQKNILFGGCYVKQVSQDNNDDEFEEIDMPNQTNSITENNINSDNNQQSHHNHQEQLVRNPQQILKSDAFNQAIIVKEEDYESLFEEIEDYIQEYQQNQNNQTELVQNIKLQKSFDNRNKFQIDVSEQLIQEIEIQDLNQKIQKVQEEANQMLKQFNKINEKKSSNKNTTAIQRIANMVTQKMQRVQSGIVKKPIKNAQFQNLANRVQQKQQEQQKELQNLGLINALQIKRISKEDDLYLACNQTKFHLNEYNIGKVLGKGAYAQVKVATHKKSNQAVALKVYEKYTLNDPQKKKNVQREIHNLKILDHPNIIKLYDSIMTPKQVILIMEYAGDTSFYTYVKNKIGRKLPEQEAKKLFKQLVEAVDYCHSQRIVHRDIKLDNILIDSKKNVKLIDFGFSVRVQDDTKMNLFCGTPNYMAPEIIQKQDYDGQLVDCWALGILLFTILCGYYPFRGNDERELFSNIIKGDLKVPVSLSPQAKNLIFKILRPNPTQRSKTKTILEDKWMIDE